MGTLENSERKVEYVKMVKQGPNKKSEMIFTGLTYIAAVLLIALAIVPTIKTVRGIDNEIKEKERVSAALKSKLQALTSLDGQYNSNKDAFEDITLIFPTNENFSLLLANIDPIVTRNGFVLKNLSFSEIKNSSKGDSYSVSTKVLVPYSVRLSVDGNRSNLIPFLKALEVLPMYPVVEGISYSGDVLEDGSTSYSITIRVYQIEDVNFYN